MTSEHRQINSQTGKPIRLLRSLAEQIVAITALLLIIAITAIGWHTVNEHTRIFTDVHVEHATNLARAIAIDIEQEVQNNNISALEKILSRHANTPGIMSLQVVDSNQHVIHRITGSAEGSPSFDSSDQTVRPPAGKERAIQIVDDRLILWEPVQNSDMLGWINLNMSLKNIKLLRTDIIDDTIIGLALALIASILLMQYYLRGPLRGIRQAAKFAADLDNQRGAQIPVDGGTTEIQQLQQALNRAARQLDAQHLAVTDSADRLQSILHSAADGIITINENGIIESFNPAAEMIFGYSANDAVGQNVKLLMPEPYHDKHDQQLQAYLETGQQEIVGSRREVTGKRKDGLIFPVEVSVTESIIGNKRMFTGMLRDITQRKLHEEQLSYLANYDILTGLPNRILLHDRIKQAKLKADENQHLAAIMFIDLDHFKIINDSLGHNAGDQLLRVIAKRLEQAVRPGDTVARIGGDEFALVIGNINHINTVYHLTDTIMQSISEPVTISDHDLVVTASIGITLYPFDDKSTVDLIMDADAAMYYAKEHGRNNYKFYTAELNVRATHRLALESSLRHALERNEFTLVYQPQVDLTTGQIIGAEALLRWACKEWGMVSPLEFIPVAEETGLILPIGQWVLKTACQQSRAWQDMGLPPLRVSVNISPRQFHHQRLPQMVAEELVSSGLLPDHLGLEFTESAILENTDKAIATMNKLSEMGMLLSIDDFGTGYSSLSYLKRFPIGTLKIDKSFIDDVTKNDDDAAIVNAILAMSHSLGIDVIAEGVETQEQMEFLRTRQCDAIQGYFFSKPLPAEQFTQLLQEKRSMKVPEAQVINMPRKKLEK